MERERKLKRAKEREKTRGDWGRGRGNACEINFKKPMPPTLDRRQRRSGQSKQESYVIMLTETPEFEALGKVLVML